MTDKSTEEAGKSGKTVHVRSATPADAAATLAIYTPFVTDTVISFEETPPELMEWRGRIQRAMGRLPWLVLEIDGVVRGYAYAGLHRARAAYRWSVDVSVYLAPDARRQGHGRRLYAALFSRLRALGYINAFAGVTLPNPGSVGLHEAMGFEPVGVYPAVGYKHGAWHDVGWWSLRLQEPDAPPTEPRSARHHG